MTTTSLTYDEALDYLYGLIDYSRQPATRYAVDFDLGRMQALVDRLGRPHEAYRVVHVAGTKGKGSTSALIASALSAAGYRTGLYTSPHLQDFTERFWVDGQPMLRDVLAERVAAVRPHMEAVPGITHFEAVTAVALWHFAQEGVDAAVVEVGLGGRLDATNVVQPAVSVITSVSYDHTQLLGNSLGEIAAEKAGIVKAGVSVVSAPQPTEAMTAVERICMQRQAPLIRVGHDWRFAVGSRSLDGQDVWIWSAEEQAEMDHFLDSPAAVGAGAWAPRRFELPLLGQHQAQNAAVAFAALKCVNDRGLVLPDQAIQRGFREVRWPGRFEVLQRDARLAVVVDSAHNRDSAEKLRQTIDDYFPGRPVVLIFGASNDKDVAGMLDELLPRVRRVVTTQAVHPRAADPDELATLVHACGRPAESRAPASAALGRALEVAEAGDIILATGSLFVVAEVRAAWPHVRPGVGAARAEHTMGTA